MSVGLGIVFLATFFWARRSPVPALLTAICVYLAATVVQVAFDPSVLSGSIVEKLACFALLVYAIRSALQQSRTDATAAAA